MSLFGPCEWCEVEAIVVVNDRRACIQHVDNAMDVTVGVFRQILAEAAAEEPES